MSGNNYVCTNPECSENGINKPSLAPIVGPVVCGKCGAECTDNGPVPEE